METAISVRQVVKHFGEVRAVDGVSFDVRRGSVLGLLGRNGAGKTTTIRMINAIFLPDSGSIEILGNLDGAAAIRDRIGYLPEERGLYRQMKVIEMLLFFAEIKGRRQADTRKEAERWLERLELAGKRDAKVEELSKGNQQKVQLISALLHHPEIVILDEPTTGLDPVNVVLVRQILRELTAEGRTVLLSTHQMPEAEKLVDDIVLIDRGKVVLAGDLAEIKSSYGKNTVQVEYDGDGAFLPTLPGVGHGNALGNSAELVLEVGADPQEILRAAVGRVRIQRFEVMAPSLEEIFISRVGQPAPAEVQP